MLQPRSSRDTRPGAPGDADPLPGRFELGIPAERRIGYHRPKRSAVTNARGLCVRPSVTLSTCLPASHAPVSAIAGSSSEPGSPCSSASTPSPARSAPTIAPTSRCPTASRRSSRTCSKRTTRTGPASSRRSSPRPTRASTIPRCRRHSSRSTTSALSQDGITVTSPYDNPQQVSADGTINFAQLDVADRGFEEVTALGEEIVEYADSLPPVEGLADRVRRRHLLRVRAPRERDLRLARGRHHPHPRLRFGARHGPPHRHRPVRAGHRVGTRVARQQRDLDARLHHRDGGDDRHRRRHRLRAVHRDEIPRGVAARPRCRGVGGRGDGHQRTRRAVRGRHGDHLAAGPVSHGSGLRAGRRDRLVDRRAHDGARVAHPAAGAPRLGRHADRQHDSRRVDRRRRRGRRHVRRCGHRSGADLLRRPPRRDHLLRPQLRDQAVAQARPAPRRATQGRAVVVPLEPVHPAPAVAERALCGGHPRTARAPAVRDPARVR